MEEFPKKEDSSFADIRKEGTAGDTFPIKAQAAAEFMAEREPGEHIWRPRVGWRRIVLAAGGVAGVLLGAFALVGYREHERVLREAGQGMEELQSAVADLKSLDTDAIREKLSQLGSGAGPDGLGGIAERFLPSIRSGAEAFRGIRGIAYQTILLAREVDFFEENLWELLLGKRGNELIEHLGTAQVILNDIAAESAKIASSTGRLRGAAGLDAGFLIPAQVDLARAQKFLSVLTGWLTSDTPHHIALLLQNPSEMRPGGGFLGSYAEVVIGRGNIESVRARDINEVDREFVGTIIPPKPLQAIAARWKTADANWFFDFPDSAEKVLAFMDQSGLYKDRSIRLEGAIALSPQVIGDLLSMTGPIKLSSYGVTLDKDNFLMEIQKQVQEEQEKRATYPKKILEELAPRLLEATGRAIKTEKKKLAVMFRDWVAKRDLMAYFREGEFQKFLDSYGATGRIYVLPRGFQGDYLAVVDANIGGGKTDLYMKQTVHLQSQIQADGRVNNHLVIMREHQGNRSGYWWYKVVNQNYLQVFTPSGAQLDNLSGGVKKTIIPQVNYAKAGYQTDPQVVEIESTERDFFNYPALRAHKEEGRTVFTTWSRTEAGETSQITLDYTHRLFLEPADGQPYQFVFERQAGSDREYVFEISAPVGYKFQENNLPVFEYRTNDPDGRLILDLTLRKI